MLTLVIAGRRRSALRCLSPALALAFAAGLAVPASLLHVRALWNGAPPTVPMARISRGTLEAGRWLRDHSRPGDLVATNALCVKGANEGCDDRFFAVSAYTERRVLVENWSFTAKTHAEAAKRDIPDESVPFWDRRRLADNDVVFRHPSPEAVRRLRDAYGVRWLFVDRTQGRPAPDLGRFTRLRHTAGDCAVYQVVG
jgi:hypothetical protein